MDIIRIPSTRLHAFTHQVFSKLGYSPRDSERAASVLHHADLRGHDTHGVANLASLYVQGVRRGEIQVEAASRWIKQRSACAVLDAAGGLGLLAAQEAMHAAISRARDFGVGCVVVQNSTHFGAAGFYAEMARKQGLIGIAMTNLGKDPVAYPMGSRDPLLGTNPISFAAPANDRIPMLLDMSTSVAASGKIKQALRRGEPVPEGWLFDPDDQPVIDPAHYYGGGARLPMLGGPNARLGGHKGMGLGLMVEVLCGALSGAHTAGQRGEPGPNSVGHFLLAFDPSFFLPVDAFGTAMDALLSSISEAVALPGHAPLQYPGQPDAETLKERQRLGVPLDHALFDQLTQLATELSLSPLLKSTSASASS